MYYLGALGNSHRIRVFQEDGEWHQASPGFTRLHQEPVGNHVLLATKPGGLEEMNWPCATQTFFEI